MAETKEATEIPEWGFQIIFDEEKVKKAGYTSKILCDHLNKPIESFGNKRIATNMWCPTEEADDELFAQMYALTLLSRSEWVMKLLKAVPCREDNEVIEDYLEIIREYPLPDVPKVY